MRQIEAAIVYNKKIADGIFELKIKGMTDCLSGFLPAQFAHIRIPGRKDLLMRRPLSINSTDIPANTAVFVYRVVGGGTQALSGLQADTALNAIMPIGNGFALDKSDRHVFLVGGGMGIVPLRAVTEVWPNRKYEAFLGFQSAKHTYHLDVFRNACKTVRISSDDGSVGERGRVTDLLKRYLQGKTPDVLLACGPNPMLKALKEITMPAGIPAYVSLEQRMGCGFGACAVCVCGVRMKDTLDYQRACVDGPVFPLNKVVL